jgi:riboflavin synthase
MFTGLVETTGVLRRREARGGGLSFAISSPIVARESQVGDSIAINGCCLTAISLDPGAGEFLVEAGEETLRRTNLGLIAAGSRVNLERSLRLSDRLGGHFVTGHVDCVGKVIRRMDHDEWADMWFEIPSPWDRQVVSKGSISVEGVSLTVVEIQENAFSVALIPHTLRETTLGEKRIGDLINLETDLLAKYVERAMVNSQ